MSITKLMKIIGLISVVITTLLILPATFVLASDYSDDRLVYALLFVNMDIRTVENSIEIAQRDKDSSRIIQLERERDDLEYQRRDIRSKQLK